MVPLSVRLWAFVRLARPHFLVGGALLYAIGAVASGIASPGRYVLGQAMVTSIQLTAHFANEHFDRSVDASVANRTLFSGGSGVLGEDVLSTTAAITAARATSAISLSLIVAIAAISVEGALIGLTALLVSWVYSAPPLRLVGTGWGELAASLTVAVAVPVEGAVLQGQIPAELGWVVATLFAVHVGMVLAFELPDLESDADAGKRGLAVRIGRRHTLLLIGSLLIMAPAAIVAVALAVGGLDAAAWWASAGSVPGVVATVASYRRNHHIATAGAVASLTIVGVALLLI